MFVHKKIVFAAILVVSIGSASAQMQPQAQAIGQHAQLLKTALTASAKGECPGNIMSALLKSACEQQQPGMGQSLAQRGSITGTEYVGLQQTQMGPAEVYKVKFQQGILTWMINTGPDGKIVVLWSPGT